MNNWWWLAIVPTSVLAFIALGTVIFRGGRWAGSVDTALANIQRDVGRILQHLGLATVVSDSPMTLTEFGEKIADEMGVRAWAEALAPNLLKEVKGTRAFEADEFAEKYVQTGLSSEWQDRVAASAYKHGLKRANIQNVLRVVLRDEILRVGEFSGPEDRPKEPSR